MAGPTSVIETCRGKGVDPCDCEAHSPSPDNPAICLECAHGISKHPKQASDISPATTALSVLTSESATRSGPELSVRDIFRKHSGMTVASSDQKSASSESNQVTSPKVSEEDAREEVLKAFKAPLVPSDSSAGGSKTKKAKTNSNKVTVDMYASLHGLLNRFQARKSSSGVLPKAERLLFEVSNVVIVRSGIKVSS